LAEAFPSVRFTYGTAGRGRMAGPSLTWTGGPDTQAVSLAAGALRHRRGPVMLHFNRTPTPAEQAGIDERAEWLAGAPNREARHKAAIAEKRRQGAAKAATTRVRKAEEAAFLAALAERWPGMTVTYVGDRSLHWHDGPTEAEVCASGVVPPAWTLGRIESEQHRRKREALDRPTRKQAARAAKTERVRKAIARYPLALADAGCRRGHPSAQLALPIDLPRRYTA